MPLSLRSMDYDLELFRDKHDLLDLLPHGVMLLDLHHRIHYLNACCAAWLGIQRDSAAGQSLSEVVSETCFLSTRKAVETMLNHSSKQVCRQCTLRTQGQPQRRVQLQYQLIQASSPATHEKRILITIEEISELTQLRLNLKKAEQELDRFSHVASHNLKTPIRNISIYAGLLARKLPTELLEPTREFFSEIDRNCQHTYRLIESILETSAIRKHRISFSAVDCTAMIHQLSQELYHTYPDEDIEIVSTDLPRVVADKTLLRLIFLHLLDNGIKFNQASKKKISITASAKDSFYEFVVSDNGIGIDANYHDKLFVLFQKLHPDTVYPGAGTGLAIAKQLVELHKGAIWIQNTAGQTCFHFTIPIHCAES